MPKICLIEGCGSPVKSRGWCRAHYTRWLRYGDAAKEVREPRRVQKFYNEVVLNYEGDECLIWPFTRCSGGYAFHYDGTKKRIASRMLCEYVHGPAPSPKHEAAHSCGNGKLGCITKRHLSWKTPLENAADKFIHGTVLRGSEAGRAKLTETDVLAIRANESDLHQTLADRYGVTEANIRAIRSGKSWGWLSHG